MHTEKKIGGELKYDGYVVKVYLDNVELENGKEATRDVVRHKLVQEIIKAYERSAEKNER